MPLHDGTPCTEKSDRNSGGKLAQVVTGCHRLAQGALRKSDASTRRHTLQQGKRQRQGYDATVPPLLASEFSVASHQTLSVTAQPPTIAFGTRGRSYLVAHLDRAHVSCPLIPTKQLLRPGVAGIGVGTA